jgi:hypothetical protein
MTPTPEQLQAWREEAHWLYLKDTSVDFDTEREFVYEAGYLRARTEQATEIAELKAKLAELKLTKPAQVGNMRFHIGVSSHLVVEAAQRHFEQRLKEREQVKYRCADCKTPLMQGYNCGHCDSFRAEEIEATIEQLLKD